jgi:predicted nucleic acid-binding protein
MFLDTSGLYCCAATDDARHQNAMTLFRAAPKRLTHSYVLAEFVALSQARKMPRRQALAYLEATENNPDIRIVWVQVDLHRAARHMLATQLDKEYSFCDAVSFVLMREAHFLEALTTDRHFEQAGFVRLLK